MSPTSYLAALPRDKRRYSFVKLYYSIKYIRVCQPFLRPLFIFFEILFILRLARVSRRGYGIAAI